MYEDQYDEPWSIGTAHSHWHMANGANTTCPLDCGAGEVYDYDPQDYED